jgi:hypothetical protein
MITPATRDWTNGPPHPGRTARESLQPVQGQEHSPRRPHEAALEPLEELQLGLALVERPSVEEHERLDLVVAGRCDRYDDRAVGVADEHDRTQPSPALRRPRLADRNPLLVSATEDKVIPPLTGPAQHRSPPSRPDRRSPRLLGFTERWVGVVLTATRYPGARCAAKVGPVNTWRCKLAVQLPVEPRRSCRGMDAVAADHAERLTR